jgi:predicted ABC-type ATPase
VKEIILLGGPNGAGKTTTARVLLPEFFELIPFLNADEMARRISPRDPDGAAFAAGRGMIQRMRDLVRDGHSFVFESTCSGRSYLRMLEQCKSDNWRISLL